MFLKISILKLEKMSTEDIQTLHEILKSLLTPDNNIIKEAEAKLAQVKQNNAVFVPVLSKIILEAPEKGVKTLASVLLRKTVTISESDSVSPKWASLDDNTKSQVKQNILQSVINETDKSQKIKFCDTMATICENVFESKENWPDLLTFIYEGISLPLEPQNITNIETVLFFISEIFGIIYEEMVSKLDGFIQTFENFFKYDNVELKTRTSQVIGEILSIVKKKESKKFKPFIPSILEHTFKCLTTGNESNVSFFVIF